MSINDVTEIVPEVSTITPFQKLVLSIGEIPTNYLDSMSYAEQVTWFCMFLQEKVLPVVNQHSEKILEIINYLNNLDLQDEVNNKLDEMTEEGTLQEIIADYLNSKAVFGYDTVASMKSATNLINGSYARTLGYLNKNDDGSALYKIRNITNEDVVDNATIIALSNEELVAELIGSLTPENTNLTVDVLLNNYNDYDIKFNANKIYEIKNSITIRDVKYYDFNNSTLIYTGENNITDLINIGYSHLTENVNIRKYAGIKNAIIDGNSKVNNCLHIVGGKTLLFENIDIKNPLQIGLLADNTVGQLWELTLTNIEANAINSSGQGTNAIKLLSMTDSYFTNIFAINGSESWLYSSANACTFTNVHGYRYPDDPTTTQTQGFHLTGNGNFFTNIIVDTADTVGIKVDGYYNIYNDITLGVKASGVGIIDKDYNTYTNIKTNSALTAVIEKPTRGSYLQVKNLQINNANNPTTDIKFDDNKIPYTFIYDNSNRASGSIYTKFRYLNKWVYYPDESITLDLPFEAGDTNYRVEVYMRNKQVGYSISKTTTQFTITFPEGSTPAGSGTNFDVYVII